MMDDAERRPELVRERLKRARLEAGLTLEKTGDALGTDFNTIWRYESGRRSPSGPVLYALATLYAKPVEWFFGEDGPAEPDPQGTADPEQSDIEADRELLMNEASLALRQVARELSPEAIKAIADFVRFTHEREERERREGQGREPR